MVQGGYVAVFRGSGHVPGVAEVGELGLTRVTWQWDGEARGVERGSGGQAGGM
jgi:hypothetical protein